ncbi:transcriptional regulator [Sphingobacterium corticibacter]|uniref:Transcriptional regulator n=1 Tax=Sphingobacterium corticibacter TaxID=2171749 RepID=A0A2T8HJ65_9SPHI|nr:transcriptional regulator [Sphingobacterium corticibacter]PVH25496.1 transcriptional regulator [Sphingobacterium corticibacter]
MKTHFATEKIVEKGVINNELDYDRALIADRKLRLLSKENPPLKNLRMKLREIIANYENLEWSDPNKIDDNKLAESEKSEAVAEQERVFIENRKQTIRPKLKQLDLTQENLGSILGHKSKTHMSELMNGIKSFTLKDLIVIHTLLKIDIALLIPVFLSVEDQEKIIAVVVKLNKPNVISTIALAKR